MALEFPDQIDWDAPVEGGWFLPLPRFQIRSDRVALMVIDMQNYLGHPNIGYGPVLYQKKPTCAKYYFSRFEQTVTPTIQSLLNFFRRRNLRIIFTRVGPQLNDGSDMIPRRQERDKEQRNEEQIPTLWPVGSYEHEIIDELRPRADEYVLDKNSSSAFNSTGINQILLNMQIADLVIVGVATDMCVDTTARDAADRGFNVVIIEDGTATFEPISHVASLYNFAKTYGMVRSAEEIMSLLVDANTKSI